MLFFLFSSVIPREELFCSELFGGERRARERAESNSYPTLTWWDFLGSSHLRRKINLQSVAEKQVLFCFFPRARMASPPLPAGTSLSNVNMNSNHVKKTGYLKKQKHGHRRFFVLKEQGDGSPARLEYYESEKKWRNKAAAKRVISLDSCLSINKRADAKHRHLIALYTKDEYFAVAAENEQEQESWYMVLTDLMSEGKVYDSAVSSSASSLVGFDEGNYGMITPANAAYKEVWQVNLKSKGLGHTRNITGVYRLCLSSRSISFVKLNSEVASVSLQLMNIRRCGHSDSFFFIEVGRSASTGPGELWMQADDSVVAQNIHETILEAMKAMKELSEFRPRSKSQSSGSNPISVPTRRNLNNLPPSQTGLVRRSRTDSVAATSPVTKFASCRIRTASEGEGTMARPVSMSISENGSPSIASHTHMCRSNTVSVGCRTSEPSLLHHSRSMSMSMPMSHSPPPAVSPLSLSSTSMNGSTSSTVHKPSSCSGSVSGSPSDTGFLSCDDYGSSPGDVRYNPLNRSNTPSSFSGTPPSREGSELCGYMMMDNQSSHSLNKIQESSRENLDMEKSYRKRTYSLTTPRQPRAPSQQSSASLDEYMLMRAVYTNGHSGQNTHSASPKVSYPEDYGDIEIGSSRSSSSNLGNDGYMPMTPGVAPQGSKNDPYMPMSPMSVSAPKQIINPRSHSQGAGCRGTTNSPCGSSMEDSGYMRMWSGSKSSLESSDGRVANGEYMNMSPVEPYVSPTPPDYFLGGSEPAQRPSPSLSSRSNKHQGTKREEDQYVLMSPQSHRPSDESNYYTMSAANPGPLLPSPSTLPPLRHSRNDGLSHRGRANRPNRLSLDTLRMLPSMNEHPLPCEPKSPGEYINIDFGENARYSLPLGSVESQGSSPSLSSMRRRSPLSDYMNLELNSHSPKSGDILASPLHEIPELTNCPCPSEEGAYFPVESRGSPCPPGTGKDDYAEMKFDDTHISPSFISENREGVAASPASRVKRLTLGDKGMPSIGAFLLPSASVDPNGGAKVIRADPHGRRRHSSETFSSTTTVTPVFPSFAHSSKRHSSASVENVSVRSSEGSDEESGSPMCRETSTGYQNGLNYIALNLMENRELRNCDSMMGFKTVSSCKGGINGLHTSPYVSLGFKETVTTVKD
ncbi:insulin receptor substrate 2a [Astyanax mexicanus]|uniref:insulin receptor substrate 2a n=1 Tax=Astyanax mexicanus TaxID=7994 RepID=UPI0020CAA963|nr:insulin receptor substrate 2a [Astyanax mexicanus]